MQLENSGDSIDFGSTMSDAFDKISADTTNETTPLNNTAAVEAPDKAAPVATVEKTEQENTDQGTKPAPDPANQQSVEAPARWSAEDKAAFAALPREAQDILLKRESDVDKLITQKTQELAEQKKGYENLSQIIEPRRQAAAANGMTVEQELNQLYQISDAAAQDPARFIQWFAGQRGVDLTQLIANTQQDQQKYVDPVLAATQQTVQQLAQRINQQDFQKTQAEIDSFHQEKGADGNPLYPHFDAVRVKMGKMMEIGEARTLKEAYDMAVYANPATRQLVLDEHRKTEEAKRHAEAKEAANKAKKAGDVNLSSKGGATGKTALGSMEDTMRDAYDRMQGTA